MAPSAGHRPEALEDGLLRLTTDEKAVDKESSSIPARQHSSRVEVYPKERTMASPRRLALAIAVCFLVTFGLASALQNSRVPCPRDPHSNGRRTVEDNGAKLEVQREREPARSFGDLLRSASPDVLHKLLHAHLPWFRDGVFPSDHDALSAVHRENAPLATTLARLARRQDGGSNTTDTPPPDTDTPPPDTETPPTDTETPPPDTETPPPDTETPPPDTSPPPSNTDTDTDPPANTDDPPPTNTGGGGSDGGSDGGDSGGGGGGGGGGGSEPTGNTPDPTPDTPTPDPTPTAQPDDPGTSPSGEPPAEDDPPPPQPDAPDNEPEPEPPSSSPDSSDSSDDDSPPDSSPEPTPASPATPKQTTPRTRGTPSKSASLFTTTSQLPDGRVATITSTSYYDVYPTEEASDAEETASLQNAAPTRTPVTFIYALVGVAAGAFLFV